MSTLSITKPQPLKNLLSLKGKTALITGGSRGIGKQVVKRFAEAEANVVYIARNKKQLDHTEKEIPGTTGFQADISKLTDTQKAVDFAVKKFGGIDILVNCAAVFPNSTTLTMTEEIWDKTFDTDTKGTFFITKFAAQAMINAGKGGRIINFLSTAALLPSTPLIAYGAAKSALWYITQTLAQELAPHKIVVNAVTPGATMTEERITALNNTAPKTEQPPQENNKQLTETTNELIKKMMPLERTGYPDDLAKTVLFLASDMAEYITGVNITVDGGQSLQNPMTTLMGDNFTPTTTIPTPHTQTTPEKTNTTKNTTTQTTALTTPEEKTNTTLDATKNTPHTNKPAPEKTNKELDGTWKASYDTPTGTQEILFNYHVEGTLLTGTVSVMNNEIKIENGKATANGFSHTYKTKARLMGTKVKVNGKLDDGKISGTIKSPTGNMAFEGTRA